MEKLKFLLIAFFFIFSPNVTSYLAAQPYGIVEAFPNLPNFSYPIELVNASDGTNRLFIAQQKGLVYVINNDPSVSTRKTFINLSSRVSQGLGERGLLGLAFHPDYENNRYLYASYTFDTVVGGTTYLKSRISRYTADISNPDTALLSTEYILLTLSQPYSNHNGGKILFGADGYLYCAYGDGGSGGDPFGNGQNRSTLLGKILRINVDSAAGGLAYSIPPTNPFYGNTDGYREEIYAYGLRNPWKISFDEPTGRLYCADVGQGAYEEISLIENGKNYGWNKMEGFHCYPSSSCDTTGRGFVRPILEYSHSVGISITGGYVYRGALLPGLVGKYIYGDYGTGRVWGLTYDGINPVVNDSLFTTPWSLSSFGVDENNEIYLCRYSSSFGDLYKIVATNVSTLKLSAIVEGYYDITNSRLNIRDTASVYLHQINSPYALVDSAKTVIDSLGFNGLCFFNNTPNGKYYIKIKTRNTIETWSRSGGDSIKKAQVRSYDFTTDSTQAFGDNEVRKGSEFCIYSGDVDQNGFIELSDIIEIFNDASEFETGYVVTDVTGDRITDLSDILIAFNNSSLFIGVISP